MTCHKGWKTSVLACPVDKLLQARDRKASFRIWHDGEKVYKAVSEHDVVLDYWAAAKGERLLAGLAAFLFAVPVLVAVGRKVGWINPAI